MSLTDMNDLALAAGADGAEAVRKSVEAAQPAAPLHTSAQPVAAADDGKRWDEPLPFNQSKPPNCRPSC